MHLEAGGDVLHEDQHGVRGEERLGDREAAVRAVVERALEELHAVRLVRVRLERQHEPRERVDALGAHRVPLVRHRARPDLLLLERLLDLAERLQHPHVARELRRARRDPRDDAEHLRVDLARVRLAGDGQGRVESHRRGDPAVELAHLRVVALEQLEEARLRAGRPLHAAQRQVREAEVEVREVEHEVLHPERRALADGGELRRLEVRVAERRLGLPLAPRTRASVRSTAITRVDAQQPEPALHLDQVGVVGDVRARRAEVDHAARRRRRLAERVHVRHHVVPEAPLVLGDLREVDVVEVRRISAIAGAGNVARRVRARPPRARARGAARARAASAADQSDSIAAEA